MDIRLLHREGHSIKQIARMTGVVATRFGRSLSGKCLVGGKEYVKERFESCALSSVRLLGEIRAMGHGWQIHPTAWSVNPTSWQVNPTAWLIDPTA